MTKVALTTRFSNNRMAVPSYAHEGDSGMDIQWNANDDEEIWFSPGQSRALQTGLFPAVPEGFELQIRSRSGLAKKKGLIVLNSPGTIDASFRGEIVVILHNASRYQSNVIRAGDRIAQAVLCPVARCHWELDVESMPTTRGDDGMGSTGL